MNDDEPNPHPSARPSIELATVRDAVALASMSRDFVEAGLSWRYRPERMAALIREPNSAVVLVRDGKLIAAFAAMTFGTGIAHLLLLCVHPQQRRRGLATALLDWLEQSARVAGIQRTVLEVRARNSAARTFYRELGFAEHLYLERYYDGVEAAFRMTRDLNADRTSRTLSR